MKKKSLSILLSLVLLSMVLGGCSNKNESYQNPSSVEGEKVVQDSPSQITEVEDKSVDSTVDLQELYSSRLGDVKNIFNYIGVEFTEEPYNYKYEKPSEVSYIIDESLPGMDNVYSNIEYKLYTKDDEDNEKGVDYLYIGIVMKVEDFNKFDFNETLFPKLRELFIKPTIDKNEYNNLVKKSNKEGNSSSTGKVYKDGEEAFISDISGNNVFYKIYIYSVEQ